MLIRTPKPGKRTITLSGAETFKIEVNLRNLDSQRVPVTITYIVVDRSSIELWARLAGNGDILPRHTCYGLDELPGISAALKAQLQSCRLACLQESHMPATTG